MCRQKWSVMSSLWSRFPTNQQKMHKDNFGLRIIQSTRSMHKMHIILSKSIKLRIPIPTYRRNLSKIQDQNPVNDQLRIKMQGKKLIRMRHLLKRLLPGQKQIMHLLWIRLFSLLQGTMSRMFSLPGVLFKSEYKSMRQQVLT